jgi:hypothetical protein
MHGSKVAQYGYQLVIVYVPENLSGEIVVLVPGHGSEYGSGEYPVCRGILPDTHATIPPSCVGGYLVIFQG